MGRTCPRVPKALGDEVNDIGAKQLQRAAENDGRCDAIDVVVTMNGDPLLRRDGRQDPIDGGRHIRERKRIVQILKPRCQEPARILDRTHAANAEQTRGHG